MRYEQEGDMYRRRARGRLIQIQRLSYPFVREGRPVLTTYLLPLYEATALYPSPPLCLGAAVCAAPRSGAAHPATHNAPTVRASNMNPGKFGAGGGAVPGVVGGVVGGRVRVCARTRERVCMACHHRLHSPQVVAHSPRTVDARDVSSVECSPQHWGRGARPGKNSEREAVIGGTIRLAWSPEQV